MMKIGWLALLLMACGGAPARVGVPDIEPPLEERLIALADGEPDRPDVAAPALLRAAALAEERGATDRARELRERIIARYGETETATHALLLSAYAAEDAGDDARHLASLLAIVCPGSEHELARCTPRAAPLRQIAEAWLRLGEVYFNAPDLPRAAVALERAADLAEDDLLIIALYKLAWTHYRRGDCGAAIAQFDRLLDARPDPALRAEAVQYLAICMAEPDWDADGQDDPERLLSRAAARTWMSSSSHVDEVLEALVGVLLDEVRCAEAAQARAELAARAPERAEALGPGFARCP